ncbi:MAG: cell envelope integrity protein TolA [Hyphomicrobiales bacterium]|nr:cell envelope integrity protein TolA [Hyphomicrobiales bacterium]MCP5000969.1 cell envelope integrity protein TolA [Hyphomicrobiales bacterium]
MKLGIIISAVGHALLLSWGLFILSAPPSHETLEIEALPVDIIPVSSITQIQQGEKKAPATEIAAPKPTSRPEPVEDAVNTGDNTVDLKPTQTEKPSKKVVEAAAEPEKADIAEPLPSPETESVPQPSQKPEPVAATEVAALPVPQREVAPDPVAEAIARAEATKPKFEPLPEKVPTPTVRPTPPKAQTAKTPERKNNRDRKQSTKLASAKDSDFNADEISALLNREDPAGGGAQRNQREASLGGQTTTTGLKLSQSEMDALRGQIQRCWQIVPGMADGADVRITVTMRLDRSGAIDGQPSVQATGGSDGAREELARGARRAVLRCAPYNLPSEKYDTWADVVVNFDPSQMF